MSRKIPIVDEKSLIEEKQNKKLNERIWRLEKRGNELKKREKHIMSTIKYLHLKIQEAQSTNFAQKISDLLMNYHELQNKLQSLLSLALVSEEDMPIYQEHMEFLNETITKIMVYENRLNEIKEQLGNKLSPRQIDDKGQQFLIKLNISFNED